MLLQKMRYGLAILASKKHDQYAALSSDQRIKKVRKSVTTSATVMARLKVVLDKCTMYRKRPWKQRFVQRLQFGVLNSGAHRFVVRGPILFSSISSRLSRLRSRMDNWREFICCMLSLTSYYFFSEKSSSSLLSPFITNSKISSSVFG